MRAMSAVQLATIQTSSVESKTPLVTESLSEKFLKIEQDLIKSPTFQSSQLSAIKQSTSNGNLHQSPQGAHNRALEQENLLYSWPLLKRQRALVAALLTTLGCIGIALCVVIITYIATGMIGSLLVFLTVEGLFWIFHIWRYYCFSKVPFKQEPSNHDGWSLFKKFIDTAEARLKEDRNGIDINEYFSAWFRGEPLGSIKKGNILDLFAYGFFYKTREAMEAEGKGYILEKMVAEMERVFTTKFPEGRNPDAKFLAHLWEPLHSVYRPLCFYLLTEFFGIVANSILKHMGFVKHQFGSFSYFTFAGNSEVAKKMSHRTGLFRQPVQRRLSAMGKPLPDPTPIVFLHGVGLGILPYVDFICALVCTGHPVVVVEFRHVAMRLCLKIPTCEEVANTVLAILDRLDVNKACFVGHSYGTFILSRILKQNNDRVHSACFIDPVCIGMFLPRLLSTFIYLPARVDTLHDFIQDAIRLAVSRELGITASMSRNFYWSDINLWAEELPPWKSLVVFSGRDLLVPYHEVRPVLEAYAPGTRVMYHPKLAHGEFLAIPSWKMEIIGEIVSLAESDYEKSQEEANAERVVRKKSLVMSVENMINMGNPLLCEIGDQLETNVAKTLSIPWKL